MADEKGEYYRSKSFCSNSFFNSTLVFADRPEFSDCFELTVHLLPALFLLICSPFKVFYYYINCPPPYATLKLQSILVLRIATAVLMAICSFVEIIFAAQFNINHSNHHLDLIYYVSPTIVLLSMLVFICLEEHERHYHSPRSQILYLFHISMVLCTIPRLCGLIIAKDGDPTQPPGFPFHKHLVTIAIFMALAVFQLFVSGISPANKENRINKDEKVNPDMGASVPSLWTFTWMNVIVWKAFKGRLSSIDDMYSNRQNDVVTYNFPIFNHLWNKYRPRNSNHQSTFVDSFRSRPLNGYSRLVNECDDTEPLLGHRSASANGLTPARNHHTCVDDPRLPNVAFSGDKTDYAFDICCGCFPKTISPNSGIHEKEPNADYIFARPDKKGRLSQELERSATWALLKTLVGTFGWRMLIGWGFMLLHTLITYVDPFLISYMLRFLQDRTAPDWIGYATAFTFLSVVLANSLIYHRGFYTIACMGITLRSCLMSAIQRKSLRLSAEARTGYTVGELVNLLSVDTQRVMESMMFLFYIWAAVLQFTISLILLWRQLGVATLAGIACLVLLMPLNLIVMWLAQRFEMKEMEWKGKRMKCLGEVFAGIRILKLYAWEPAFDKRIFALRRNELWQMLLVSLGWDFVQMVWSMAPYAVLLVTFTAYTMQLYTSTNSLVGSMFVNGTNPVELVGLLTPEKIFVSVNLFNLLRVPMTALPWSISSCVMAFISLRRLAIFFMVPEHDTKSVAFYGDAAQPNQKAVQLKNATFAWESEGRPILKKLNLTLPQGALVAVVGRVGSGKSSLISACLGEMLRLQGSAHVKGNLAYVPQLAWIQQHTVRGNILFGSQYEPDFYEKVLEACALLTDLEMLSEGDETEIGERGVNLSGGQRQRVNLARAVYQNADVYFLDDPLSAVDTHVGRHLFDEVIGPNGMLKKKTRLLVTNHFQYLNQVDWILVLGENGEIEQSGTYEELVKSTSGKFVEFLKVIEEETIEKEQEEKKHKRTTSGAFSGCDDDVCMLQGSDMSGSIRINMDRSRHCSNSNRDNNDHTIGQQTITGSDIVIGSIERLASGMLSIPASRQISDAGTCEIIGRTPPIRMGTGFDTKSEKNPHWRRPSTDTHNAGSRHAHRDIGMDNDGENENDGDKTLVNIESSPLLRKRNTINTQNETGENSPDVKPLQLSITSPKSKTNADSSPTSNFPKERRHLFEIASNDLFASASFNGPTAISPRPVVSNKEHMDLSTLIGRSNTSEQVLQGRVSTSAYWMYFVARGFCITFGALSGYAAFLAVQVFSNYWLQWFADDGPLKFASDELRYNISVMNKTERRHYADIVFGITHNYIVGYAWTGFGQLLAIMLFVLLGTWSNMRACERMHRKMVSSVLRAPTAFFDKTPIGRLLNRFSTDIEGIDHKLPSAVNEVVTAGGDTLIACGVVLATVRPIWLAFCIALPLFCMFFIVQSMYLPCSRQARRLDIITRTPVISNYSETAASTAGSSVVNAFGRQKEVIRAVDKLIDSNSNFVWLKYASNRWLDTRLDALGGVFVLAAALISVVQRDSMTPGMAGLIITYALQCSGMLTWLLKQISDLETNAVSLERIHEYSIVKSEADWTTGPDSPSPPNWPTAHCRVLFKNTVVRYPRTVKNDEEDTDSVQNDDEAALLDHVGHTDTNNVDSMEDAALKSINLCLGGSVSERRIGVCGRTGAGKSSLAAALFRLIEADKSGSIFVDNIDISRLGLHDLRSKFSILPQEPVLFSGSLRTNLDPFETRQESELWNALESAHLFEWARALPDGLDHECGEAGSNLSVGQRQLVCLARVFLSSGGRVRLLVLDEATAAMDPTTDQLVMQAILSNHFSEATVIIIAHRLSTIMDADKIVVMNKGRIVETGKPQELLANPDSHFARMNAEHKK